MLKWKSENYQQILPLDYSAQSLLEVRFDIIIFRYPSAEGREQGLSPSLSPGGQRRP